MTSVNFDVLDKQGEVITKYTKEACFARLSDIDNKDKIGAIHYFPKLNCSPTEAMAFVFGMRQCGLFVDQCLEDIINNGYLFEMKKWFDKTPPNMTVIMFALTMMRYVDEFPNIIRDYLTLQETIPGITRIQAFQLSHFMHPGNAAGHCLMSTGYYGTYQQDRYLSETELVAAIYKQPTPFLVDYAGSRVHSVWNTGADMFFKKWITESKRSPIEIHRKLNEKTKTICSVAAPLRKTI